LSPFIVEAAADAPLCASLIDIEGEASSPQGAIVGGIRQVVDLIAGLGESSYESLTVGKLAIVVTEGAPYSVKLSTPLVSLARDGSIDLVATVGRAKGFDEAIEVSFPNLPPGVEMDGPGIVSPGRSDVVLRLFARPDADPVSWWLAAEARPPPRRDRREMTLTLMAQINATAGSGQGARRRRESAESLPSVASRLVPLELKPSPVVGRFEPASVEQGKTVTLACTLEPATAITGPMTATLEGLPPRAAAAPVAVAPGSGRVLFSVIIGATTPVGEYETLACRLTGEVEGREVAYRVGRGGRLKVHMPGALMTGPGGRPLSALDALRLWERAAGGRPPDRGPKP
jgi:hypothetical protein